MTTKQNDFTVNSFLASVFSHILVVDSPSQKWRAFPQAIRRTFSRSFRRSVQRSFLDVSHPIALSIILTISNDPDNKYQDRMATVRQDDIHFVSCITNEVS